MGEARNNAPINPFELIGRAIKELFAIFFRTLATFFFVMVITGCILVCAVTVYVVGFLDDESEVDLNSLELNYTSIMYVQDEETGEYVELNRLHGEENRIWVDYEDIPQDLINAAIAAEDRRFKLHQGVDWLSTAKATVGYFFSDETRGDSTITQQLIKN
ncbi:MAG: transglycosylase domain-containing protein, partial [Lentisphaeria bacterium]|nr:transglycosylase domain-containing protein [Lentisphaeria bacterium]